MSAKRLRYDSTESAHKGKTKEAIAGTLSEFRRHLVCELDGLVPNHNTSQIQRVNSNSSTGRRAIAVLDRPTLALRWLEGMALGVVEDVMMGREALSLSAFRKLA